MDKHGHAFELLVALIAFASVTGLVYLFLNYLSGGPDDATVKQVEMLAHIIKKKEFTVTEVAKSTGVSKSTVWRFVNKLNDLDLVENTGRERSPKAARERPSKIYRYIEKN